MAKPTLPELRRKAKQQGIPASEIRAATSTRDLRDLIAEYADDGNGDASPVRKRAVVKKAAASKPRRGTVKRGRPKGSASSKSAPASSRKRGTAKRATAAKTTKRSNGYVPKGGRNVIDVSEIDFNYTEGWNARPDSAPDRIFKALKRSRGNRQRAFEILAPDVWDFVGRRMADGTKRDKQNALSMLKYRIARTLWDFVRLTEQHEIAENRIEYGTGGNGNSKTRKPVRKASTKTGTAKRGRPKGSTTKTKTAPARRGRPPKVEAPKRRGRPPGSKNKVRATASASAPKRRGRPPGSKNKRR